MVKSTLVTGFLFISYLSASINPDTIGETTTAPSGVRSIMDSTIVFKTANLIIERLSPHVYQHISFLNTSDFGKVSCNGMIVADGGEAIIFDTPASMDGSAELIAYVTGQLGFHITAVIPTHFHEDCVAGLEVFNDHAIPVYASNRTLAQFKTKAIKLSTPINGFDKELTLPIGDHKVIAGYFGEGHTTDNIIGFYPRENALFGGCLIKALGAGKGNLTDANTRQWSETVKKLWQKFPQAEIIIPGHGNYGGPALLEYTIQLFQFQ